MKVLSVASEVFPLIKTGGLADVAGALPLALVAQGVEMRTLLPGYPAVISALSGPSFVHTFENLFGGRAHLLAARHGALALFVLDAPHLYNRPGNIYSGADNLDWADNAERFAALSWVGAWLGRGAVAAFQPDIVHVHDWQAGLTPAYLRFGGERGAPSLITIHNIAFQGRFSPAIFPRLGLPDTAFSSECVEFYGDVSYLKAGLACSDAITTVSPSYAREIMTEAFGMGLDGLLRHRGAHLSGILNGIDTTIWDPAADEHLPHHFSQRKMSGRAACRAALESRFGLLGTGPIVTVISRLTHQKGLDLLAESLDELVSLGCRLALLGSGERTLEESLKNASLRHPGRASVVLGYDEPLAHLMQAGGDVILIPSRFEPCGLTQLCALRYGTIPVVSRVGGLNDTIIDANEAALQSGVGTGFQFTGFSRHEFIDAIRRMLEIYNNPDVWKILVRNAMKSDVSWSRSSGRYAALYQTLAA